MRVNPREPKHAGNEIRVKRGFPRGRARGEDKWIGETAARSDGAADPPHFVSEAEVVIDSLELVRVVEQDQPQPQQQGDRDHPEKRSAGLRPPALNAAFLISKRGSRDGSHLL